MTFKTNVNIIFLGALLRPAVKRFDLQAILICHSDIGSVFIDLVIYVFGHIVTLTVRQTFQIVYSQS